VTTAFVLSGGGSLGAVQVGMLQALTAHGIVPDFLVGTSAGALNAAFVAGRGTGEAAVNELEDIWVSLRRSDVFPLQATRLAAAALGRATSLCSPDPLRRLVEGYLDFELIEEAAVPLHLIATDVLGGTEVVLSEGPAVPAVLASAAIPAVFPSVRVGDRMLVDGGIANNAAVSVAVGLNADVIYVLPTGYTCALESPPPSPLASALHALTLLIEQRLVVEVGYLAEVADIRVLPPLCPLSVPSTDFRYAQVVINQARQASDRWLVQGGTSLPRQDRFLSLHRHHVGESCAAGGDASAA
jgi:NTE family protein